MTTAVQTPPPSPPVPVARMTADEFGRLYAGRYAELIDGVPVELHSPPQSGGRSCHHKTLEICAVVDANDPGHAAVDDSFGHARTKENSQQPQEEDVCYFSYDVRPGSHVPVGPFPVAENLVVEVRSPPTAWPEMFGIIGKHLETGIGVVLLLDPHTRTASVYRNAGDVPHQIFTHSDVLTIPDVLPGFSVPVARFFE